MDTPESRLVGRHRIVRGVDTQVTAYVDMTGRFKLKQKSPSITNQHQVGPRGSERNSKALEGYLTIVELERC